MKPPVFAAVGSNQKVLIEQRVVDRAEAIVDRTEAMD
jgi:hypothetical protein